MGILPRQDPLTTTPTLAPGVPSGLVSSSILSSFAIVSPTIVPQTSTSPIPIPGAIPSTTSSASFSPTTLATASASTDHEKSISTGSSSSTQKADESTTQTTLRTSTATASQTVKPTNNNLSNGEVAGVAIACFAIGAIIAGLLLFYFFLRKRRSHESAPAYQQTPIRSNNGLEKGAPAANPTRRSYVTSSIDNQLPLPVEDKVITNELSKIRDNIKNHVRSYYHFEPVPVAGVKTSQLSGLATATGISTSTLVELFLDAQERADAIRVYIAWAALSRCTGERYPNLLPDEVAKMAIIATGQDGRHSVQTPLFSKWKVISGALLQQRYGQQLQAYDSRARSIDDAIREIDAVLQPFTTADAEAAQRRKNLEMILGRSAQLAFLIFSQPGSFQLDFSYTGGSGSLVVFPGLIQTVGDDAQPMRPHGRRMFEKEIVPKSGTAR